jgi:hypothetical protein
LTVACAARQTPAPMEYLLRKAGLSQEKSMLSSDIRNFMSQRTIRISDPAPLMSHMKPECFRGVHCIRLVIRCFRPHVQGREENRPRLAKEWGKGIGAFIPLPTFPCQTGRSSRPVC